MLQLPYTPVGPGIFRPFVAVWLTGPGGSTLADGLLDTGADRTLLTPTVALSIGIDVHALPAAAALLSASGQAMPCKMIHLDLCLARNSTRISWRGEVAVPLVPLSKCHWGFKGFLEFFRSEFDGPNRMVTLIPGPSLPAVPPPTP